jgi:hypothetical protein
MDLWNRVSDAGRVGGFGIPGELLPKEVVLPNAFSA